MASSPQSYQKRQRELRKKERKAEKQAIRHGRSAAKKEEGEDEGEGPSEDELLEEFRVLNEAFAAGTVEQDDFEYRKAEIFAAMGLGEPPEPRDEATDEEAATAE